MNLVLSAIILAVTALLFSGSCIVRRRRTRHRLHRWAATLGLPLRAGEGNAALRARVLAETQRQEQELSAARQQRAEKDSGCSKCGGYMMYSARQRGDGMCGPCSRVANGTANGTANAVDRANARWGRT